MSFLTFITDRQNFRLIHFRVTYFETFTMDLNTAQCPSFFGTQLKLKKRTHSGPKRLNDVSWIYIWHQFPPRYSLFCEQAVPNCRL
jgi:hypothetical protein